METFILRQIQLQKWRIKLKGKRPNDLKRYPLKIRLMFYICLMGFLILLTCIGMADSYNALPIMLVPFTVILVILIMILFTLSTALFFHSKSKKHYKGLECLLEKSKYKQLCYQLGLYVVSVDSSEDIIFPNREITNNGFRVEALPGLSERLLDSVDDFNGVLYRNHTELTIEECYLKSGWIYYKITHNFRKARIKGV